MLAHRLGKCLSAPVYELDRICYVGGRGGIGARYRPYEDRLADVARIAGQAAWTAEGIYLRWTEELLREADTVIWLDLPWRIAAWRIIARHMRRSQRGRNRYQGIGRLIAFVLWTGRYYWYKGPPLPIPGYADVATRAATEQFLAPYTSKVIRLKHPRDVNDLVARMENDPGTQLSAGQLSRQGERYDAL
jgi:hypothetical protein